MLFNQSYSIPYVSTSIQEVVYFNQENTQFTDAFRLLKKISKHQFIFRYRYTGRVGAIKVLIENKGNDIHLQVFQAAIGFAIPVFIWLIALFFYFDQEPLAAQYLFVFGLLWLLLIYFSFKSASKKMEQLFTNTLDQYRKD